jgi:hypothetical protein
VLNRITFLCILLLLNLLKITSALLTLTIIIQCAQAPTSGSYMKKPNFNIPIFGDILTFFQGDSLKLY